MSDDFPGISPNLKRYVVISAIAGTLDFLIAFALLHSGFSIAASLAISIVIAGIADYFALEWWGFSRRAGHFSAKRLFGSGLAELGTYGIRVAVLWLWKHYLPGIEAKDHLIGLAAAYTVAFLFGYIVRTWFVFAHSNKTQ